MKCPEHRLICELEEKLVDADLVEKTGKLQGLIIIKCRGYLPFKLARARAVLVFFTCMLSSVYLTTLRKEGGPRTPCTKNS